MECGVKVKVTVLVDLQELLVTVLKMESNVYRSRFRFPHLFADFDAITIGYVMTNFSWNTKLTTTIIHYYKLHVNRRFKQTTRYRFNNNRDTFLMFCIKLFNSQRK